MYKFVHIHLKNNAVLFSLDIKDLYDVLKEIISVAAKWDNIWLALGLPGEERHTTARDWNYDCSKCLEATIERWLKQNYDIDEIHEKPSWKMLVQAIKDPCGGNNNALAKEIAQKYRGTNQYLIITVTIITICST